MPTAFPLVFTFLGVTLAGFAVFWGLSLFLQKYLYQEPADKLVLRAAVAGLLLGCFLTAWVYINTRADGENKYGAIHQFSPNDVSGPVPKFQAVRSYPNAKKEETVAFERQTVGGGQQYLNADRKPFAVNSGDFITTALILDDGGRPVRYEAVMNDKGVYVGTDKYTFREKDGGRTVELTNPYNSAEPVTVSSPSGGVVFLALLLNVLHLAVWFVCFWPVLRFGLGHALGLATVFTAVATILLMPLLFQANPVPKLPPPAAVQKP